MRNTTNIIGQKFNRWTVLQFSYKDKKYQKYWLCECDCGIKRNVRECCLRSGSSISCGCYAHEISSKRTKPGRHSAEYGIYHGMITRCYNSKTKNYHIYGGRGIKVCERWLESFDNFIADMGVRPSVEYSIDRYPDKNGNYELSNCRWATQKEQMSNVSYNVWIEHDGRRMILIDWANFLKVPEPVIRYHLKRKKPEEAIEYLKNFKGKKICIGQFKDGLLIKRYNKSKELYQNGFGISNVYVCLRGDSPIYKGFTWKYLDKEPVNVNL